MSVFKDFLDLENLVKNSRTFKDPQEPYYFFFYHLTVNSRLIWELKKWHVFMAHSVYELKQVKQWHSITSTTGTLPLEDTCCWLSDVLLNTFKKFISHANMELNAQYSTDVHCTVTSCRSGTSF